MHMIPVSPASSTELAIAVLTAAPILAGVIIRIVLCVLAAAATRKALEDPADGQASSDALRAHRLAVCGPSWPRSASATMPNPAGTTAG